MGDPQKFTKHGQLTKEECKKILSMLGFELGISPNLITTRLLSDNDKVDMLDGLIPIVSLRANIEVWRDNGLPDYAHGLTEPMKTRPYI